MRDRILTGLTILLLAGCEAAGGMPGDIGGSGATGAGAESHTNSSGGISGGVQPSTGATSAAPTATGGSGAGGSNPASATGGAPVNPSTGGAPVNPSTGGAPINPSTGGAPVNPSTGGVSGSPPQPTGGTVNTGGASNPASSGGTGNIMQATGGASTGGASTGGASTGGGTGTEEVDCNAAMPTGGQQHSGNGQGGSGNLAWQIWSNVGSGNLTTFSTPAFIASWNNSGDYLGRIGYEWGNSAKTYDAYGTITAQFAYKRTGSGGGYSYFGMYGWTTNPCVEWYIVDDSFNGMPVNPGNTSNKGTVDIDGGSYIMYTRNTTGTGGSRCSGASSWVQYYSVRKTARQCGTISLTQHFDAWKSLGMPLGNLLEAKILVEVGGGTGSAEFPVANVMATSP